MHSLTEYKKIVIKIGSSSLTHDSGLIDLWKMEQLVKQIANLYNKGLSVIVVSSGAIAAGMGKMKFESRPKEIHEKQAAAAVGQSTLMHMYEKFFSEYGITVAQVLLTKEDMDNPSRRQHSINALSTLIKYGIVPIVNENDVVAIDEIKVGDNDTLSAEVCFMMDYEMLIILSDIDGVYDKDPRCNPDAVMIPLIESLEAMNLISAGGSGSEVGTGGMQTKLGAARLLSEAHKDLLIVNSQTENILNLVFTGKAHGTLFRFSGRNKSS